MEGLREMSSAEFVERERGKDVQRKNDQTANFRSPRLGFTIFLDATREIRQLRKEESAQIR